MKGRKEGRKGGKEGGRKGRQIRETHLFFFFFSNSLGILNCLHLVSCHPFILPKTMKQTNK